VTIAGETPVTAGRSLRWLPSDLQIQIVCSGKATYVTHLAVLGYLDVEGGNPTPEMAQSSSIPAHNGLAQPLPGYRLQTAAFRPPKVRGSYMQSGPVVRRTRVEMRSLSATQKYLQTSAPRERRTAGLQLTTFRNSGSVAPRALATSDGPFCFVGLPVFPSTLLTSSRTLRFAESTIIPTVPIYAAKKLSQRRYQTSFKPN
jgi:hypothetical protein